ncbi:MAG: hypothetical protein WAO98_04130, partial [Alphaproteobacteria bacterium]
PSAAAPPSVGSPAITTTTTEISVNYQNEQSAKGSFAMAALGIILLILVCLIVVAFCVVPLIVIVRCIINKELDKVEKTLWAVFTFLMPLVGFVYLIVVEKSRFWKTTGVLCLVAFGLFVVAIITAGVVGVAGLSPDEIKTMMHTATQKR